MKQKLILLSVVTLVLVVIDQISKNWIVRDFEYGQSLDVISNFFNITYVRNYGAAFGMLSQVQASVRDLFFLLMPPCAMAIIFVMLKMAPEQEKIRNTSLCFVFAGALGNYIDRLRYGYVVDFLDFHYYERWAWPAFNVADMAIVCGVSLLILLEIFQPQKTTSHSK